MSLTAHSNSASLPLKAPNHHRHHSAGPLSTSHRVTRRKSMSANPPNIAAVAQAVKEAAEAQLSASAAAGGAVFGSLNGDGVVMHGYPSPPNSLSATGTLSHTSSLAGNVGVPPQLKRNGGATLLNGSAIADGHALEVSRPAPRNRRASEGAGALGAGKIGRMRSGSELKCDKCGKGYKHGSCLTKHLFVSPSVLPRIGLGNKNCSPTPHFGLLQTRPMLPSGYHRCYSIALILFNFCFSYPSMFIPSLS